MTRNTKSMTRNTQLILIRHYGDWVKEHLDGGWDGYLFTFLFNQLPGSVRAKSQQMEREIVRWYGRLATRTVRKPRSPKWAPLLPKGVFVPDLPVLRSPSRTFGMCLSTMGFICMGLGSLTGWEGFLSLWMFISRTDWMNISRATSGTLTLSILPIWRNT
jgi:hypothetical protein